jgi:hypothetical protein
MTSRIGKGAVRGILIVVLSLSASLCHAQSLRDAASGDKMTLAAPISLTSEEQAWIKAHPKIRVHLMAWPPFKIDARIPPRGASPSTTWS